MPQGILNKGSFAQYKVTKTTKQKTRFKGEEKEMKGFKKLLTGILAATMIMGASMTAYAENEGTNSTTQEQIQKAEGVTGSASITMTNTHAGETYRIYKIFDATSDGTNISYKLVEGKNAAPTGFNVDAAGNVYYTANQGKSVGDEGFVSELSSADIENLKTYIVGMTPIATVNENEDGSFTVPELPYGYYFINTTTGALVTVNSNTPSATIADKNDITTTEKKVQEDTISTTITEETGFGDKSDAEINETVNYRSTISIKAGAKNLVFHDEMTTSNDLITDSITLTASKNVNNTNTSVSISDNDYSVSLSDADANGKVHGFTITFTDTFTSANAGTDIRIMYQAKLNNSAVIYGSESVGFDGGNDNRSRITYDNHTNFEWDWTRTYTYPIHILKTDSAANPNPLSGAKFVIYKNGAASGKVSFAKFDNNNKLTGWTTDVEETEANLVKNEESFFTDAQATLLESGSDGKIDLTGFDAGSYKILEVTAPTGYNKLTDPISIAINGVSNATVQGNDDNSQGFAQGTEPSYTSSQDTDSDGVLTVHSVADTNQIKNNSGAILPSTGGIGTTIFYIIGGVLIIAGVAYFIVRRKADAE